MRVLVTMALLCAFLVAFAPAPLLRREKPAPSPFAGWWHSEDDGLSRSPARFRLHRDGRYEEVWFGGNEYHGQWVPSPDRAVEMNVRWGANPEPPSGGYGATLTLEFLHADRVFMREYRVFFRKGAGE